MGNLRSAGTLAGEKEELVMAEGGAKAENFSRWTKARATPAEREGYLRRGCRAQGQSSLNEVLRS